MEHLRTLFDTKAEVAGWLVLACVPVGLYFERLEQWPAVALVVVALITLLGAQHYAGVRVSPQGIEVDRD